LLERYRILLPIEKENVIKIYKNIIFKKKKENINILPLVYFIEIKRCDIAIILSNMH